MTPSRLLLLLLPLLLMISSGVETKLMKTTSKTAKIVSIAKCCGLNETLTSEGKCLKYRNSSWNINIFANNTLRPYVGSLPANWRLKEDVRPDCPNRVVESVQQKTAIPSITGYLRSLNYGETLTPDKYCLDYEYLMVCPKSEPKVVVKKCCGEDWIFHETNLTCVHFRHPNYSIDLGRDSYRIGVGYPVCPGTDDYVVVAKFDEAYLMENGSLWLNASDIFLPPTNYCLEHIFEKAGRSPSILTCREYVPTKEPDQQPQLKLTLYPIALAISAIFLAATLAAGSLLPATHHVLHWRCQTNHVACLLVADVLLCITQIAGAHFDKWPCFSIAVAMHFLFLAAFFWLNTMCFNIWWTFRDLRPQSTEKSQERLRLYLYQAYAWGVPFVIVFIGAVADLAAPDNYDRTGFLRPKFAVNQCWFGGNNEVLTYFFGPMGTLLVINLLLFGLTARELTCGLWKRELVKSTTERAALGRVCAKLVVVMGVTWIMDVVSWAAGGPDYLWYLTDIINCLQGVFIFIVVGCQPQVYSAVKRSWCALRHRDNIGLGTTNNDRHSSSSQGLPSVGGETLTNNSTITNTTKSQVPMETNC